MKLVQRGFPARSLLAFVLCVLLGLPQMLRADEWYESYRKGLAALERRDGAEAARYIEAAAAGGPEPGDNVAAGGNAAIDRYYPYLALADAYMLIGELDKAREALKKSDAIGKEPSNARFRLSVRLRTLYGDRMRAQKAPMLHEEPVAPTSKETTGAAAEEVNAPKKPPASLPGFPPAEPTRAPPQPETVSPPAGSADVADIGAAQDMPASITIVSTPPGALVYLDDELIGETDPATGRLVKNELPVGRHKIRLTLAGFESHTGEIEVAEHQETRYAQGLTATKRPNWHLPAASVVGLTAFVLVSLTIARNRRKRTAAAAVGGTIAQTRFVPKTDSTDQTTEVFGSYRLLRLLGRGGMAAVWKAERADEVVALKRPLPSLLDEPEFVKRFLREAAIGRTLHHPNIIRIIDGGEVGSTPYFTMELIDGTTLRSHIETHGALDPRFAARLIAQVAEALDYAHLKGVIHRDLKPSNIMLLPDGTAKVMDYGIARASRFEGITATGNFLGTPDYVAPEVAEGKGCTGASDLYSLGIVLYEILTGRRPFVADTAVAVLHKHIVEPPTPPTLIVPTCPARLEQIILKLLAKSPANRYANAEELLIELREYLNSPTAV